MSRDGSRHPKQSLGPAALALTPKRGRGNRRVRAFRQPPSTEERRYQEGYEARLNDWIANGTVRVAFSAEELAALTAKVKEYQRTHAGLGVLVGMNGLNQF